MLKISFHFIFVFFFFFKLNSKFVCKEVQTQNNMSMDKFLRLLSPALEWIVKGLSTGQDTIKLDEIMKWCTLQSKPCVIFIIHKTLYSLVIINIY